MITNTISKKEKAFFIDDLFSFAALNLTIFISLGFIFA